MKNRLKGLIKALYVCSGVLMVTRWLLRLFYGPAITILYGHRVFPDHILADADNPRNISSQLSVSEFKKIIRLLKKYYKFLSLDDAIAQLKEGNIKCDSIVMTFDDGFCDNYTSVLPVAKELDIPVVFYVSTSVIGSKRSLWFQAIISWFCKHRGDTLYVPANETTYDMSSPQKRIDSANSFIGYILEAHPPQQHLDIIEDISKGQCTPEDLDRPLSWGEVKKLDREPLITIGSHTVNHYRLTSCDRDTALQEIQLSRKQLEEQLGHPITHFSYPEGRFAASHVQMLKQTGYTSAVTTVHDVNRKGADLYRLNRISLPPKISKGGPEFLIAVAGIPHLVSKIRKSFTG